jgi:hypothetical protein
MTLRISLEIHRHTNTRGDVTLTSKFKRKRKKYLRSPKRNFISFRKQLRPNYF